MMSTHYFRLHEFRVKSQKIKPREVVQDSKPRPIEEISIRFTHRRCLIRRRCTVDSEVIDLHVRFHPQIPLRYHKLNVGVFKEGDDSLFHYLSAWLLRYGLTENIQSMANAIIAKWIEVKDAVSRTYDRKVFPLFVDLTILDYVTICEQCTLLRELLEIDDDEEDDRG